MPDTVTAPSGPLSRDPVVVRVATSQVLAGVLGPRDEFIDVVERRYPGVRVGARGHEIRIRGESAERVGQLFSELASLVEQGERVDADAIGRAADMLDAEEQPRELMSTEIIRAPDGTPVRPRTVGQKKYVDAIADSIVTFGIGPAGTGKSWLAVAMAVRALQRREVDRIVLTRPAVEAGERLGFLPGDLLAKVDPFLRPLYDALQDLLGAEGVLKASERGSVEVAPLAYMRGRTLNRSFVILDEAQNTSPEQMKMFLTRLGFGSRAVITGDRTQVDVPGGRSGLSGVEHLLAGIDGLSVVHLHRRDIIRHRIVQDIVDAYERAGGSSGDGPTGGDVQASGAGTTSR